MTPTSPPGFTRPPGVPVPAEPRARRYPRRLPRWVHASSASARAAGRLPTEEHRRPRESGLSGGLKVSEGRVRAAISSAVVGSGTGGWRHSQGSVYRLLVLCWFMYSRAATISGSAITPPDSSDSIRAVCQVGRPSAEVFGGQIMRRNGASHGSRGVPALRPGVGGRPLTDLSARSVFSAGPVALGRRAQKYAELAVALEDGRGVDEVASANPARAN
jgi:hypothetical protein